MKSDDGVGQMFGEMDCGPGGETLNERCGDGGSEDYADGIPKGQSADYGGLQGG